MGCTGPPVSGAGSVGLGGTHQFGALTEPYEPVPITQGRHIARRASKPAPIRPRRGTGAGEDVS